MDVMSDTVRNHPQWYQPQLFRRACWCGWTTAYFSTRVTEARLHRHVQRHHPAPLKPPPPDQLSLETAQSGESAGTSPAGDRPSTTHRASPLVAPPPLTFSPVISTTI